MPRGLSSESARRVRHALGREPLQDLSPATCGNPRYFLAIFHTPEIQYKPSNPPFFRSFCLAYKVQRCFRRAESPHQTGGIRPYRVRHSLGLLAESSFEPDRYSKELVSG